MANRVYINVLGTNITFVSSCTEDIQVQAQSQFTRIGEFVPGIDSIATLMNTMGTTLNGGLGAGMVQLKNALDVPIWQKTEPVKVTTDLNFFIKTSGYDDVWVPTMILQSMNILSQSKTNGQMVTPGLNVSTIGKISEGANSKSNDLALSQNLARYQIAGASSSANLPQFANFSSTSKMCSVYIPAIVYLPMAIVEVVQPTWSKQLSSEGYPLWSKVNVQFTGCTPAVFEDNFLSIEPSSVQGRGFNL